MNARIEHGYSAYVKKRCRCLEICQPEYLARIKWYRDKRRDKAKNNPSAIPHDLGGYTNYGCRCAVCEQAAKDHNASYYANTHPKPDPKPSQNHSNTQEGHS